MRIFHFYGAKGGVGTTTATCLFAADQAKQGRSVALMDMTGTDDVNGVLGWEPNEDGLVVPNLWCVDHVDDDDTFDLLVMDYGTAPPIDLDGLDVILVVENSYLCMLRHLRSHQPFTRVLLVEHRNRALGVTDIKATMNLTDQLIVVPHADAMARAVDAGLLLVATKHRPAFTVEGLM